MKRCFCIGDIHGRLSALNEVLAKADFNDDKDRLITLGDIVDGGDHTKECIDRLLQIKDRIDVRGNHCSWFMGWMNSDPNNAFYVNYIWQDQGGNATMRSYDYNVSNIPESHKQFFNNQVLYYIDDQNRIFVHGGFKPGVPIESQDPEDIMWDRDLVFYAKKQPVPGYNKVFVGHTTVKLVIGNNKPVVPQFHNNLVMCDCGGKLAIINVDNPAEYYLSKKQRRRGR
jgi:serine/threonine protein phosphatase 1